MRLISTNFESALVLMNKVLTLEPNLSDAYQIKAQILMGLGKQQQATEAMSQAVDKRPEDYRLRLRYARHADPGETVRASLGRIYPARYGSAG